MKIIRYNQYNFILENFPAEMIKESSEFIDLQTGLMSNPLGAGYGLATDPTMSIYSDATSPYVDNYSKKSQMVNDLSRIMKNMYGYMTTNIQQHKLDYFLDDIDEFKNLKILRIFKNNDLYLDIFISFQLNDDEFFGVYRNFNGISDPRLKCDLFSDVRYNYIDTEYYLKLNTYLFKIITNWFIPTIGDYKVLQDIIVKDSMGTAKTIKKGSFFKLKGHSEDNNGKLFIMLKYKNDIYTISGNDFYYFKYWTEKVTS
jgi:hypothetical protein